MGILRKATDETTTIYLDESDYIVVRKDLAKRQFNKLAAQMPEKAEGAALSVGDAVGFTAELFTYLVVGWSLSEGQPTAEDYGDLSAESATAIDAKLADHFATLLPSDAEGKAPSN